MCSECGTSHLIAWTQLERVYSKVSGVSLTGLLILPDSEAREGPPSWMVLHGPFYHWCPAIPKHDPSCEQAYTFDIQVQPTVIQLTMTKLLIPLEARTVQPSCDARMFSFRLTLWELWIFTCKNGQSISPLRMIQNLNLECDLQYMYSCKWSLFCVGIDQSKIVPG